MVESQPPSGDSRALRWTGASSSRNPAGASPPPSPRRTLPDWHTPSRISSPVESLKRLERRRSSNVSSSTPQPGTGPTRASTTSSQNSTGTARGQSMSMTDKIIHQNSSPETVVPISTMSLPVFRSKRPKIYWPSKSGENRQLINSVPVTNPVQKFSKDFIRNCVGTSRKSYVMAGQFQLDDGEEWLAVKITDYENESDLALAPEYETLRKLQHNHIIAVVGTYREIDRESSVFRLGLLLFPLARQSLMKSISLISQHNAGQLKLRPATWSIHPWAITILSYFACLCRAVLYLHHQQLTKHRDIKPTNILIDRDDTVVLADFDISKKYRSNHEAVTLGKTNYTLQYAPKKVINSEARGFDWDVNCLGFVFLEMATVVFGETYENLVNSLLGRERCEKCCEWGHLHSECAAIHEMWETEQHSRPGERNEDEHKVVFSEALENGRIHAWINHLRDISSRYHDQMPHWLFMSDGQDLSTQFLDMVIAMMEADGPQEEILEEAWNLFSKFNATDCKHCHPKRTPYGNGPRIDKDKLAPPTIRTDTRSRGLANTIASSNSMRNALESIPQELESQAQTTAEHITLDRLSESKPLSEEAAGYPYSQQPSLGTFDPQNTQNVTDTSPVTEDSNLPQVHISRASTMASRNDDLDPGTQTQDKYMKEIGPLAEEDSDDDIESRQDTVSSMIHDGTEALGDYKTPLPTRLHDSKDLRAPEKGFFELGPPLPLQRKDDFPPLETVMSPLQEPNEPLKAENSASTSAPGELRLKSWTREEGPRNINKDAVDGRWVVVYDPKTQTRLVLSKRKLLDDYVHNHIGFLVRLPRNGGSEFRCPRVYQMDLWKSLGFWCNAKRLLGRLRWIFVLGRFTEIELAEDVQPSLNIPR